MLLPAPKQEEEDDSHPFNLPSPDPFDYHHNLTHYAERTHKLGQARLQERAKQREQDRAFGLGAYYSGASFDRDFMGRVGVSGGGSASSASSAGGSGSGSGSGAGAVAAVKKHGEAYTEDHPSYVSSSPSPLQVARADPAYQRQLRERQKVLKQVQNAEFVNALAKTYYTYRDDYVALQKFTEEVTGEKERKRWKELAQKKAEEEAGARASAGARRTAPRPKSSSGALPPINSARNIASR